MQTLLELLPIEGVDEHDVGDEMTIPLSLLVAHFIGDFLLQSDWMATNKSKRMDALALHVAVYSLCFLPWGMEFVAVTILTHFFTDAITSRITSKLWFFKPFMDWNPAVGDPNHVDSPNCPDKLWYPVPGNNRHWFFVAIGADQLIHYITLALTLRLLA